MTWLSRLLPQSPRLPRLADQNHRTRQAQRRRRMSTLEALEGRTLLSNVTTSISMPPPAAAQPSTSRVTLSRTRSLSRKTTPPARLP